MCWLMKTSEPAARATVFLSWPPTASSGSSDSKVDWQRGIAARPSLYQLAIQHHTYHRVVDVSRNGAIVYQERAGNRAQAAERLMLVNADRFVG